MRKQVFIEQRTPEWLAWRGDRMGASDANVLEGVSPYKTLLQLYQEKIKRNQGEVNANMRAGTFFEDDARKIACKQLGVAYTPECFDHPTKSFMFASLDGWEESNGPLELKLANRDDHDQAKAGIVPEKYMPQCQQQMGVTESPSMMYGSYVLIENRVADIAFVMVRKDQQRVERIESLAESFYDRILSYDEPEPTERDFVRFEDTKNLAKVLRELREQKKLTERQLEDVESEILAVVGNHNAYLGDMKVSKVSRQGNVDYKKLIEDYKTIVKHYEFIIDDHEIDRDLDTIGLDSTRLKIDLYRKPSSQYHKFD